MPTTTINGLEIEGDGTQDYPLLVHNYDELKACIETSTITGNPNPRYVELANDIDGNDYEIGTVFNIQKGYTTPVYFNLAGYAIQNWYINGLRNNGSTNNNTCCLFYCYGSMYIHDGKILNIFGHYTPDFASSCVVYTIGTSYVATTLVENIAFSMDISKCVCAMFDGATKYPAAYKNCSFYIQSSTPLGNTGLLSGYAHFVFANTGARYISCDFKFYKISVECVTGNNANAAIRPAPGSSNNYTIQMTQCRFQGGITIRNKPDTAILSTTDLTLFIYMLFDNCVFNIHLIKDVPEEYGDDQLHVYTHTNYSSNRLTLMNIDYLDEVSLPTGTLYGIVQAHTDQMDMRENPQADEVLNNDLHWDVQKG